MDQVRPLPTRSPREHAQRRLVDLSSSNPIRWRPCADPVQKRDPGERITQKGLTDRGPLQKGGQSDPSAVAQRAKAESVPTIWDEIAEGWWARREVRLCPPYNP